MEIQKVANDSPFPVHVTATRQDFSDALHIFTFWQLQSATSGHCHPLRALRKKQEGGGKVDNMALAYQVEDSRSKSGCLALQQTHFALGENKLAETQSPKSRSGYLLKCRPTGHN